MKKRMICCTSILKVRFTNGYSKKFVLAPLSTNQRVPLSHNESGTRLSLPRSTMHFEYRTSFLYELVPSITIRTLALVMADFHLHDQIFHANRKAEQADRAETIFTKWS